MNIWILIGIIFLAIILVIIAIVIIAKKPKPTKVIKTKKVETVDFEDLMAIVKNPKTSSDKLLETLQKFNENYSISDENEQKYIIFLSRVLTHKNVNKDIFQYFHKDVKSKNKNHNKELEIIERKALG